MLGSTKFQLPATEKHNSHGSLNYLVDSQMKQTTDLHNRLELEYWPFCDYLLIVVSSAMFKWDPTLDLAQRPAFEIFANPMQKIEQSQKEDWKQLREIFRWLITSWVSTPSALIYLKWPTVKLFCNANAITKNRLHQNNQVSQKGLPDPSYHHHPCLALLLFSIPSSPAFYGLCCYHQFHLKKKN